MMDFTDFPRLIAEHRQRIEEESKKAREIAKWYTERADALDNLLHMVVAGPEIYVANVPHLYPPTAGQDGADMPGEVRKKKPNAQMYEEIMLEHGKPIHLIDLLDKALARGLQQQGTGAPENQLRNSLNSSKKRFCNLGNNMWWLADRPLPQDPPDEGRHPPNGQGNRLFCIPAQSH